MVKSVNRMRVITKISVSEQKTVIAKEIIGANTEGIEPKIIYTNREIDARKNVLQNAEKIILYALILLLGIHLVRQDALEAFTGVSASAYSFIDGMQTVLLIICSGISLRYTLSKRVYSYQSIFNILFGFSAYLLLLEQGIFFYDSSDYILCLFIGITILCFTGLQGYKYRHSLWSDFKVYYKTKSYAFASFTLFLVLLLPAMFNDEVFMQVQVNDVCISLSEKITLYLQLFGNIFLLIAIGEFALKVRQQNKIEAIFE